MIPFTKVIHLKRLITIALLIISVSFTVFFTDYLKFYPAQSEEAWQGQYQAMSKWVYRHAGNQAVWISAEPELHALLFYAWYNRIDPALIQQAHRTYDSSVFIDRFGQTSLLNSAHDDGKCQMFKSTGLVVLTGAQALNLSSLPIQEFFYYNPSAQPPLAFAVYQISQLTETDQRTLKYSCNQL